MHCVVDLPGDTLEQGTEHDDNNGMREHEEKHSEAKVTEFECMIICDHGPPSLYQYLHENELGADESPEI